MAYEIQGLPADVEETDHGTWTELEVRSVSGDPLELKFLDDYEAGAWCLPLDLTTEIDATPGSGYLRAIAHRSLGIAGARAAVIPAGDNQTRGLRDAMRASDLAVNVCGGPWATRAESYLCAFDDAPTMDNADTWLEICETADIYHMHTRQSLRFGDYTPRAVSYDSADDLLEVIEYLNGYGVTMSLHAYVPAVDPDVTLLENTIPFPTGAYSYRLPANEAACREIARNIGNAMRRYGFSDIYLDALDWVRYIDNDFRWYWLRYMTNAVFTECWHTCHRAESSNWGVWDWPFVSRRGCMDQGNGESLDTFLTRLDASYAASGHGLPRILGWVNTNYWGIRPWTDASVARLLAYDLPIAVRNMDPKYWVKSNTVQSFAKLIGQR